MPRRRSNPLHDAELARLAVAAAAAVVGAPLDLVMGSARSVPEFSIVRLAAATALRIAGWSRERVLAHVPTDGAALTTAKCGARLRTNAPRLLEAAQRALAQAAEVRPGDTVETVAREVMRREAAVAGLSPKSAATSKSPKARRVRIEVARRLYAREFSGADIARAMGYSETTVYRWLSEGRRKAGVV